jgi:probable rRNA maturation factor
MNQGRGPRARVIRRRRGGISITAKELQSLVERALRAGDAPRDGEATLTLVDDREITALNAAHMGVRGPTDVLSFPLLEPTRFPERPGTRRRAAHRGVRPVASAGETLPLGDIVVSIDRAIEQAREGRGGEDGATRHTPADELRLLVVHGALHLCGWDHRGPQAQTAMWSEQRRILRAHARAKQ